MHQDRRRDIRIAQDGYVGVQLVEGSHIPRQQDCLLYCALTDLSVRGMGVESSRKYNAGADVKLTLNIPSSAGKTSEVVHLGRVQWIEELEKGSRYRTGIKLMGTSRSGQSAWDTYVYQHLRS